MKRCPTCDNTFEDSLRFCQADGTPLVDDAPPLDPYATMVASPAEIKAASQADNAPVPIAEPDNMLDLPAPGGDMMKTMVASADEMRQLLEEKDDPGMEIPEAPAAAPAPEPPAAPVPEPPKFSEPEIASPHFSNAPNFSDIAPPPPSPFEVPKPASSLSSFDDEPPTKMQPFPEPPPAVAPAAPAAAAPPAQVEPSAPLPVPPPPPAAGQSKTLAVVSMILGILGLTLCCGSVLPSLIAIITGFMARSKAANDPVAYGGGSLAMIGLITGVLGVVASLAWLAFLFLFGGMRALERAF